MNAGKLLTFALLAGTLSLFNACREPEAWADQNSIVRGCTDPGAENFNPDAVLDDNSCITINPYQNSLLLFFTNLDNAAAGTIGAQVFHDAMIANRGRVLALALHDGDNFNTPINDPLINGFQIFVNQGQPLAVPSIAVNKTNYGQSVSNASTAVDNNFKKSPALAIGYHHSIGGGKNLGKINVDIIIKFLEPLNGKYYMTIVAFYKKTVEPQAVATGVYYDEFEHVNVLLGPLSSNGLYGELILDGNAAANSNFVFSRALPVPDPDWDLGKIDIGVIVWKKITDTQYEFVNCSLSPR